MFTIKNTSTQTLEILDGSDVIRLMPRKSATVKKITPQIENLISKRMIKKS